jgi:GDP-L-fucose synthase
MSVESPDFVLWITSLIYASTPPNPMAPPRKLMDVSRLHTLGWKAKISLEDGIRGVVEDIETGKIAFK